MAYSDYGGYAYKNGKRIDERSDAVLSPEGIQSTPGAWPGWTIEAGRSGGSWHALLGDGPIFVGLYKQSTVALHRLDARIDLLDTAHNLQSEQIKEYEGKRYIDAPHGLKNHPEACRFEIDGHVLEVFWCEEDNFYVYARLTQPDGNIWTGFSGYGVGAGLDDGEYGFSTEDRELALLDYFPALPSGADHG